MYFYICLFVLILKYIFHIIYDKFLFIYCCSLIIPILYKKYKLKQLLVIKQKLTKNDIANYLEII